MERPALRQEQILGSWSLASITLMGKAAAAKAPPFGDKPTGILHYLADGRMAVMIQQADRPAIPGGRAGGSDAEWAGAARSFTAYAGRYTLEDSQIIHHVELNSYPNEVGVAYPRMARLEDGYLILETPPDLPPEQRPMRLVWRRLPAA